MVFTHFSVLWTYVFTAQCIFRIINLPNISPLYTSVNIIYMYMQFYHTGDLINMTENNNSVFLAKNLKELLAELRASYYLSLWAYYHEIEFLNFYGAQEPIPRNQFRQPL